MNFPECFQRAALLARMVSKPALSHSPLCEASARCPSCPSREKRPLGPRAPRRHAIPASALVRDSIGSLGCDHSTASRRGRTGAGEGGLCFWRKDLLVGLWSPCPPGTTSSQPGPWMAATFLSSARPGAGAAALPRSAVRHAGSWDQSGCGALA